MPVVPVQVQACYALWYGRATVRIQALAKFSNRSRKQDSGNRLARRFRMSVGSGIDADHTEKRKTVSSMEYYRINGVARRLLWAYAGVLWVWAC